MVELRRIAALNHSLGRIIAKLEACNPAGSIKDRAALAMVEDAERRGLLQPGVPLIESTSGNTGIGLALVCALKGYRLILTMPEGMSAERRRILSAYGAETVCTPAQDGMQGAIEKAEELHRSIPGSLILQQFNNPANPASHYQSTAEEIWKDTQGQIDGLVAGIGTGGSLCGAGRRLKELNPRIQIIGVEPASSSVLSGGKAGLHAIQGIGGGFIPGNYDAGLVDYIVPVSDTQAIDTARLMARKEGILCGFSSGAAVYAALRLSQKEFFRDKTLVVLLPDSGERYLSTNLYNLED